MEQKIVETILEVTRLFSKNVVKKVENNIKQKSFQIKRYVFRTTIELIILSTAMFFLIIGFILLLNKFFPLYAVLIVTSLILINLILIIGKFR